jgi:hypothetical protein
LNPLPNPLPPHKDDQTPSMSYLYYNFHILTPTRNFPYMHFLYDLQTS